MQTLERRKAKTLETIMKNPAHASWYGINLQNYDKNVKELYKYINVCMDSIQNEGIAEKLSQSIVMDTQCVWFIISTWNEQKKTKAKPSILKKGVQNVIVKSILLRIIDFCTLRELIIITHSHILNNTCTQHSYTYTPMEKKWIISVIFAWNKSFQSRKRKRKCYRSLYSQKSFASSSINGKVAFLYS